MKRSESILLKVGLVFFVMVLSRGASGLEYPWFDSGFEKLPLQVLALEPAIALNQEGVVATAHVEGLTETPAAVRLIGPAAQQINPAFAFDPQASGLLEIKVPEGMATGEWELQVDRADSGSTGTLSAALTVANALTVSFTTSPMALPATGGMLELNSSGGFTDVPVVLLRDTTAPANEPAVPVPGVEFQSTDRITIPLPASFAPGTYDVMVINPDGSAGVEGSALILSANPPPRIHSIWPITQSDSISAVVAQGSGFQFGASVSVVCEDSGPLVVANLVVSDANNLGFDLDRSSATTYEVCLLNILNPDAQQVSFSGLLLVSPTGNPDQLEAVSELSVARRAPAVASIRSGPDSWRMYAIGGDTGSLAGALDSIEFTNIDAFGGVGPWQSSGQQLPAGRTFSWAAGIGEFIYLFGGSDGSDPLNSALRAQVLSPADAPVLIRHTLRAWPHATLAAGHYSYRISAVFPSDDPRNPDGESLAGSPRNLVVPVSPSLVVQLDWNPVPGASGYRVYRAQIGGDFELLAETSMTRYFDDGQITPDPVALPLTEGETGTWHSVAGWQLNTARSHFAGAVSPVPGDPDAFALYAFGGMDGDGDKLSSYEYALVSAASSDTPSLGGWNLGTDSLAVPVSNAAAWSVPALDGSDEHWMFVGGGFDDSEIDQSFVERGLVSAGGDAGTFAPAATTLTDAAGGAPVSRPQGLGLIGGRQGVASSNSQFCSVSDIGAGPVTSNWNNGPGVPDGVAVIHAATVAVTPFWFMVGGYNGTDGALPKVYSIRY